MTPAVYTYPFDLWTQHTNGSHAKKRRNIVKHFFLIFAIICAAGRWCAQAQVKTSFLVQSTIEDEWIVLSIDKVVYFAGDTVHLSIRRSDSSHAATIVPVLPIEGVPLKSVGRYSYIAVLPQNITPGAYAVNLRVQDAQGRHFWDKTDCMVTVEEHQDVAQLKSFVRLAPVSGGPNSRSAVALDREVIQNLEIQFNRDSIALGMGPQFITIKTTLIPRDGAESRPLERRIVTFRSRGDANDDRMLFIQYRNAYSKYAMLSPEEVDHVRLPVDTLPDWALLVVQIEPDYAIKIGAIDRSNIITQYFRVRGPSLEIGFLIGIPKVLYDSQAGDQIEYGNTSAMVRVFYVSEKTGNRFPLNAGVGTFGVNSPIDVGIGRGGIALSALLDLAEMVRIINIGFTNKVNIGLEITHLWSIDKKARFLLDTQVSLAL
jgi:hypothetical protein